MIKKSDSDDALRLLLVHADDGREVLEGGMDRDATVAGPKVDEPEALDHLFNLSRDPNSLPAQRWGVVISSHADDGGERLLELIEPLRKVRQAQQGGHDVVVYRVPRGMSAEQTMRWRADTYNGGDIHGKDVPRYLLVLGDADAVSFEFQQQMAGEAFIGRLAFTDPRGYEAYIHKVLAWEKAQAAERARALFYTVRDGTPATAVGDRALMTPTIAGARADQGSGDFPAREIIEIGADGAGLLEQVAARDPSLLFTISHGLGPTRRGWASAAERERLQGAMSLGVGERITAEDVASRPFLPGGIWFFLACYGAGTPRGSAYEDWLRALKDAGRFSGRVDSVLAGLPKAGERPFVAALPQAVLANTDGPLAVIGHVDLAWTYGFQDLGPDAKDRPARFQGVFKSLIDGNRAGAAHAELLRFYVQTATHLTTIYSGDESARIRGAPRVLDDAEKARRANMWMQASDLGAYVLLGDPAVRLPLAAHGAVEAARVPAARPAERAVEIAAAPAAPARRDLLSFGIVTKPARDPKDMERAVLEVLKGQERPEVIAERLDLKVRELEKWLAAYKKAGLEALGKLR